MNPRYTSQACSKDLPIQQRRKRLGCGHCGWEEMRLRFWGLL
ncbi:hypothetical protein NW808_10095 [Synechococcus sp. W70.1]